MMNLKDMKVAELRTVAREQELSCYNRETKKAMTKLELVAMLEAYFTATTAPEVETVTEVPETASEAEVIVNNTDVSAMVTELIKENTYTVEVNKENATIMFKDGEEIVKAFSINKMAFEYITNAQLEKLVQRLGKETVIPVKLYKHYVTDTLYLTCRNKVNPDKEKVFTFIFRTDGFTRGNGWSDAKVYDGNAYEELVVFS